MSGAYPKRASSQQDVLTSKDIQTELTRAVKSATATRAPYKKHAVIFIHFSDDDIGCDAPERELATTFRDFYGIHNITHILLNSNENPTPVIQGALIDLKKKGNTALDCLVIIVFSGHGRLELKKPVSEHRGPEYTLILGGTANFSTPPLDWVEATSTLNREPCDVLHILDCCYAGEHYAGNAELLAAATEEASAVLQTSFTNALNIELRRLSSQSFTISTLFQTLMDNRTALKLERLPFYAKREGRDPIVLGRATNKGKGTVAPKPNGRRILLTAHVDRDLNVHDLQGLKNWLTNLLPASIVGMDIKLEGAWKASSSLLLFSLPITVWAQIDRSSTAYTYVGEVTSDNMLLQQSSQGSALAFRPPQGSENTKPGQTSQQK